MMGDHLLVKVQKIKKVLMVVYTIYPSDARVMREAETIAALENNNVSILVLKEQDKPRSYVKDRVHVVELDIEKYRGKRFVKYMMSYVRFLIRAFIAVSIRTIRGQVDIVHVHNMPNFIVFSATLPKLLGKPIILDIHDSMPETYAAKFQEGEKSIIFKILSWEEAICAKFANRVICVNHVQKKAIRKRAIPDSKITVSMNVPDPKRFTYCASPPKHPAHPRPFNLVYHGTITNRLGVDLTIKAVAMLTDRIPGIKFHIIGNGDDMNAFMALSRQAQC